MICHVAVTVVAHVRLCCSQGCSSVCAKPCIQFGRFNAFLLLFQIEESKGTSAITVTRGTMRLSSGSAIFMDGNSHYFIVIEHNNKNM